MEAGMNSEVAYFGFLLSTLYIILDIYQPPSLSSAKKIDD